MQTFPPGSHVITPRCGFLHHGIYVGEGKVVHYAGSTHCLLSGPVEEISLDRFADGRPVWASCNTSSKFGSDEVIRRARSRVGEKHYRLISNNCEHLCEWCLRDVHRSHQIEAWLSIPSQSWGALIALANKFYKYLFTGVGNDIEQS